MKKLLKFLFANFQVLNFLLAFGILFAIAYWYYLPQTQSISNPENNNQARLENKTTSPTQSDSSIPVNPNTSTIEGDNTTTDTDSPQVNDNTTTPLPQPKTLTTKPDVKPYLGHFPFEETTPNRLVNMGRYYDRVEYLDQEAAQAFKAMKTEAQKQGIELVLISGFRDEEVQKQLFTRQVKRQGSKEAAAKLSAPSGHSEHHTGYAVDIGDGKQPSMDLKFEFESTAAYKWLIKNAANYGFELSFVRDNAQGISFEPWHWRYIGTTRAQEIFAAPRSLSSTQN